MEMLGKNELEQALLLLDKAIQAEGGNPIEFVVCGGASLIVTQLVPRTTKDIDILILFGDLNRFLKVRQGRIRVFA